MADKLTHRQLLVSILALWYGLSQKEIAALVGIPHRRVSQYLRRGEIKDEVFERLLAAIDCPRAAVQAVSSCLESLEAVDRDDGLTPEEKVVVEEVAREIALLTREKMTQTVHRSRAVPVEGYPEEHDLIPARQRAGELFSRLEPLAEPMRLTLVQEAEEYQIWSLCERVCLASAREASRKVERAAAWARLAQEIAARVQGPEIWRSRIQGYAAAHAANVLRVSGELKAADAAFEEAKRLWSSGSDPERVLDPGKLLDLEASLRRDQRRLDEALALLDEAVAVGRCPERALIKKGFTLEVMGQYERAVDTLLQALPLIDSLSDPRLENLLNFNLAVNFCHVGRFKDAAELVPLMRGLAAELGDEIDLIRMDWLDGRIAAGLGRSFEARRLLSEARREFGQRGMEADAALALLEEAALLLDAGRTAEVKVLARELTRVLESKGVHREALAALRLFYEAAEREEATADLARRILRYLFRARYDQGLRFTES